MARNQENKDFIILPRSIPEKFYNQLNGKSAAENYKTLRSRQREEFLLSLYKSRRREEIEKEIDSEIERELPQKIEQSIAEILERLNKGI